MVSRASSVSVIGQTDSVGTRLPASVRDAGCHLLPEYSVWFHWFVTG